MSKSVITTKEFRKSLRLAIRQGKDIDELKIVIENLSLGIELNKKYKNHKLVNSRYYYDCYECHIKPDWLLIYKYSNNNLVLILVDTGSHSELFK